MSQATRSRGLYLLAALCLVASVALSAHLMVSGSAAVTTGGSHHAIATTTTGKAPLASASKGLPTDRSQDRHSRGSQQPAGLEESEDGPAKKLVSGFAALSPAFEVWTEEVSWKPETTVVQVVSDDYPQLRQRPPPAR